VPLSIGAVAYLNTRPLVAGLAGTPGIALSYAVPALLAERMAAGLLDVALLPIVELSRLPHLELVPGLGITTCGPSRSVLLVGRRPPHEIRSLALDPHSRTSNVLARVLLAEVWGVAPRCTIGPAELDAALETADAAVRIGDKALFEPLPAGTIAHDLGAVWTERTGLPFVFAAWAARPGVVDRRLYVLLHDCRRRGRQQVARIAADYSWNGRKDPQLALAYLTEHMRYRLGAAELRGIERFFRAAHAHGLVDTVPEVRFALARRGAPHAAAQARGVIR
jgi:chorismate dehydratase